MNTNNKSFGIAVLQSTSKTLFRTRCLSHNGLILLAKNPHNVSGQFRNIIEEDSSGVLRAADIPDLSDLALMPKFLKCYHEWLLCNSDETTILEAIAEIQQQTSTCIPKNQEMFYLEDGTINELNIKSYSNVMKTVVFNENIIEAVMITFETKANTDDWCDGRTTNVALGLKSTDRMPTVGIKRKKHNDSVRRMIIWNCRGLAKNGFRRVYDYLLESHWPDILILTEARVSNFLAEAILPKKSYDTMKVCEPIGLLGGVIILSMSEDLKLGMRNWQGECDAEITLQ